MTTPKDFQNNRAITPYFLTAIGANRYSHVNEYSLESKPGQGIKTRDMINWEAYDKYGSSTATLAKLDTQGQLISLCSVLGIQLRGPWEWATEGIPTPVTQLKKGDLFKLTPNHEVVNTVTWVSNDYPPEGWIIVIYKYSAMRDSFWTGLSKIVSLKGLIRNGDAETVYLLHSFSPKFSVDRPVTVIDHECKFTGIIKSIFKSSATLEYRYVVETNNGALVTCYEDDITPFPD